MILWTIGYPESARLELVIAPEYQDDCGYEWLSAAARIKAGSFSGKVEMSILYSDLVHFYEQLEPLYRNLKGRAEFRTLEGQIELDVEVDRTGHIETRGILMDAAGIGNALNFIFRFDQTNLAETVRQLKSCIDRIKRKEA